MSYNPGSGSGSNRLSTDGDVALNNPADGHVLRYDATLGKWQNQTPASALVQSVNGYTNAVVLSQSDVGLGNVNNTSDLAKPISTAAQTQFNTLATKIAAYDAGEVT